MNDSTGTFFDDITRILSSNLGANVVLWIAILHFYFALMILPLVGQAGRMVYHYGANLATFAGILAFGLFWSVVAFWAMGERCKRTGEAYRWKRIGWHMVPVGLIVVNALLLVCLFTGLLSV